MSRCIDCHWLLVKVLHGRELRSCQDLGEIEQNAACERFTEKKDVPSDALSTVVTPPKVDPVEVEEYLGTLAHQKYREIYHEILAESFVMEQDLRLAIHTVKAQLQTQGADITVDGTEFERMAAKLVDLHVLYRLINATGMASFTDQIMEMAITRAFKPAGSAPVTKVKR